MQNLSKSAVREIFLKERLSLADGTKIVPVNSTLGTPLRKQFQERVLEMKEFVEARHWQKMKKLNISAFWSTAPVLLPQAAAA